MSTSHVWLRGAAIFLAGSTALSATWDLQTSRKAAVTTPSVLLITLDTVRADHIGCYGYSRIETPAIDRLASDGVRFENAYTLVPITLPSHAVILTGTYPMFSGVRDFTSPPLPANVPTLAEMLRHHGYHTAAFVSSFVLNSMWGLNRGFEVYDDDMAIDLNHTRFLFLLARRGDYTTDRFLTWLDRNGNKPFFAWLHLYDAHSPYRSPDPYHSHYSGRPYDGAIAFDDAQVGRVMSRLRALNLYDDTLVVLLSDHGESLGEHGEAEHGFFVYNATIHIPLVLKLPKQASRALAVSQPVSSLDVASTIAQVCRVPAAESGSLQGRSLLGTTISGGLSGPKPGPSQAVYAESFYPLHSFGWHPLRALVTDGLKYIDAPRPELYDLQRDPGERLNIVAGNSATAAALRDDLTAVGRRFAAPERNSPAPTLDAETLEKLKSLGYVAYKAGAVENDGNETAADPKDNVGVFNRILRASDLSGVGKYADADETLAQVEREEPDLYVVPFQRGENFLAWGRPALAVAEFSKALSRNPTFDQAALGLGRAHFLLGQNEQAATAFELALRSNKNNFLAKAALAKVHWKQNQVGKAELEFREITKSHPEFGEAHADDGIMLTILGRYSEALPEIQRGIELGSQEAIAYNYLGVCQAELGHPSDAIHSYEKAVELDPRYSVAYLNLALQYRNQGFRAKALAYFETVCRLSEELCKQYASQFAPPKS